MLIKTKKKNKFSFEDALKFCSKSFDNSENKSPRAAVYVGKMGKSSKKAIQMQVNNSKTSQSHIKNKSLKNKAISHLLDNMSNMNVSIKIAMFALISAILLCVFCYQPAKVYYTQVRQTQKAEVELALVQARNDILSSNVNSLKTDEGIEDKAKNDYGYVSKGEGVARISGLETQKSSVLPTYVDSNKVVAPSTPVTDVLDVLFSYDNSPK